MLQLTQLRDKLLIDKHCLDDELVHQAQYLETVSSAYAQAVSERDLAKENLRVTDADLSLSIRDALNGEKVTEALITSKILLDAVHKKAFEDLNAAEFRVNELAGLKESFLQRSYALNKLAELYIANYFQRNSVSGKHTRAAEEDSYNKTRARLRSKRQE